jgi:hypothetical protein
MTDSITIPKSRFDQALRHLIEARLEMVISRSTDGLEG